jgi:hypothetical protein
VNVSESVKERDSLCVCECVSEGVRIGGERGGR